MSDHENPNEYDENAYLDACRVIEDAVETMWAAGANEDDIIDVVKNHIQNIT